MRRTGIRRTGVAAIVVGAILLSIGPAAAQDYPSGSGSPPVVPASSLFPSSSAPGVAPSSTPRSSIVGAGVLNHLPSLAFTGFGLLLLVFLALAAIAVGLVALRLSRRSRARSS